MHFYLMKPIKILLACLLLSSLTSITAQALMLDRGMGLMYDNVLNVTWPHGSCHIKTIGYSGTGLMDWVSEDTWVTNLNFEGLTGWRLPTYTSINGSGFNYNTSSNGITDISSNISSAKNDSVNSHNVNMTANDYYSASSMTQSDFGFFSNSTYGNQNNTDLAANLQSHAYGLYPEPGTYSRFPADVWALILGDGNLALDPKHYHKAVWPPRPLDFVAVSELSSFWLLSIGLMCFLALRRTGISGH
jgi:hypothetical protein